MKQIYDFERFTPPVLNERMLRRELQKRAERQRTILLAVAGVLLEVLTVLLGLLCMETYPILTLGCVCFAAVSAVGSGVITIVYVQKGGMNYGSVY